LVLNDESTVVGQDQRLVDLKKRITSGNISAKCNNFQQEKITIMEVSPVRRIDIKIESIPSSGFASHRPRAHAAASRYTLAYSQGKGLLPVNRHKAIVFRVL
jgi:hypothetical protein